MATTCSFIKATDARSLARNTTLLWNEVCGIQEGILAAIDAGAYEATIADGTPMTQVNEVQSVTIVNGGSNYFPVEATATIVHPNGINGSVIPVVNGGVITGFTVAVPGTGYEPVESTINMTGVGNGDAVIVPYVDSAGGITAYAVTTPGTGYVIGDIVPAVRAAGTGVDFVATVNSINGTGGVLTIDITTNGTGYDAVVATVTITHPNGAGFDGAVNVTSGVITGVTILDGGVSYNILYPTATVTSATGQGAVLDIGATDITAGVIDSIQVTDGGYGYSTTDTITITAAQTSSGSSAIASPVIDPDLNDWGTNAPLYYNVVSGQSSDRVLTDQIEFIQDYFTALGYNIRAQVNPATANTMQWYIIW